MITKEDLQACLDRNDFLNEPDIDLKKLSGIQINYNPEDYYTAYKLGKLLNTTNLVEDPSLKDSIIILTKD